MKDGLNVLSLFNGMSCGRIALDNLDVKVKKYYSAEIDKYANQAAQALYPDTIQLGDVTKWREWDIDWTSIDLVTGGFPCQAWSMAGKQLGDKDERGMLFWTMLDIMKHVKYHNPKAHFLIENVKMKKEFEEYITTHTENALGHVHKILINSALVSAQNRNRYYWTSFAVEQPQDQGIMLKDIIEHGGEYTYMSDKFVNRQKGRKCLRDDLDGKAVNLSAMEYVKNGRQGDYIKCGAMRGRYIVDGKSGDHLVDSQKGITEQRLELRKDEKTNTLTTVQKDNLVVRPCEPREFNADSLCHHAATATDIKGNDSVKRVYASSGKSPTLTTMGGGHREPKVSINKENVKYRKLTPRECMRLQTVPEQHIEALLNAGISNTQLYKMTGNGWTVDVISHILGHIKWT